MWIIYFDSRFSYKNLCPFEYASQNQYTEKEKSTTKITVPGKDLIQN